MEILRDVNFAIFAGNLSTVRMWKNFWGENVDESSLIKQIVWKVLANMLANIQAIFHCT